MYTFELKKKSKLAKTYVGHCDATRESGFMHHVYGQIPVLFKDFQSQFHTFP